MKIDKTLANWLGFFNADKFSAYILAGGLSKRIGFNKLLAPIGQISLLDNTILIYSKIFKSVIIVTKEKNSFSDYEIPILLDDPLAQGPMSGILTALEHCPTDSCFISASDFWDITPDLIHQLYKKYNNEDFLGYCINDRRQPLFGIYKKSSLEAIRQIAKMGNYKMVDLLGSLKSRYVTIKLDNWRNINYPDDLKTLRSLYV